MYYFIAHQSNPTSPVDPPACDGESIGKESGAFPDGNIGDFCPCSSVFSYDDLFNIKI